MVVHLVSENNRWDAATLSAPAGKTWQVEIENRVLISGAGTTPHNFIVETGPDVASRIFTSPKFQDDKTQTYELPGIPAGTYTFVCSFHRNTMSGTLTLE